MKKILGCIAVLVLAFVASDAECQRVYLHKVNPATDSIIRYTLPRILTTNVDTTVTMYQPPPLIEIVKKVSNVPLPNQIPIVNAGVPQTINLPTNTATLTGTASDPDGTIVSYLWAKISGVPVAISTPTQKTTAITGLVQGVYIFRLTVTDNSGATASSTTTVTVNAAPVGNLPPIARGGADVTITGPYVILDGSTSSDPDGTIAGQTWIKISGPSAYRVDNPTLLRCGFSQLVNGVYTFRLTVTDNKGASGSDDVNVTVGGIIPPPPIDTIQPPPPSGGPYLDLPLYNGAGALSPGVARITGNNITISGYSFSNKGTANNGHCLWVSGNNIIIENNYFFEGNGLAIYVMGGSNITIRNNFGAHVKWGFLIQRTTGNVKVYNNQGLNMQWDRIATGCCNGQFVFFDNATGPGNEVIGNRVENFIGESYNEDLVNTFGSGGTVASPMLIKDNIFRGGGPSLTSGGIIGGDLGSQNLDIRDNVLVNPGWYGFQFVSGQNLKFTNNKVYSDQLPWSRIGFLIYRIPGYPPCNNITVGPTNWSNVKNESGAFMNFESNGTCGPVTPPSTGQSLASMNVPSHLLTFITEDQLWQLRDKRIRYDRIVANGLAYGGYDLTRPNASATVTGNILRSTSVATNGNSIFAYRWVQVSGTGTIVFASPTAATTTVTGPAGTYVVRLEVYQQNKGNGGKVQTSHSVRVTVNL